MKCPYIMQVSMYTTPTVFQPFLSSSPLSHMAETLVRNLFWSWHVPFSSSCSWFWTDCGISLLSEEGCLCYSLFTLSSLGGEFLASKEDWKKRFVSRCTLKTVLLISLNWAPCTQQRWTSCCWQGACSFKLLTICVCSCTAVLFKAQTVHNCCKTLFDGF